MLASFKLNPISKVAFFLISLIIAGFVFLHLPINAFSHDVFGYYLYLPLTFKYHNLDIHDFNTVQEIIVKYHNTESFYQAFKLESGNWVMKYSMGMAVLYLPFYFIGELLAQAFNYPMDGFSKPYQISVLAGCFLYTVFGLAVLRKILLHFFSDKLSALLLLLVVFATNFFFHVSFHGQGLMSHNMLFMLHAITFWNTIRWHQNKKLKYVVWLGISIGLSAIVRPTEIIVVVFPLLYGVVSFETLKQKIKLLFTSDRLHLTMLVFIIFVLVSYQLFYWKIMTGRFLYNSYSSNPAEGLNFLHPYILEVLFSFRKGWFIYTPVMLIAVLGLVWLFRHNKAIFPALTIFILINFYIVASWSCWWYASSYSSRALIPSYVFMAIPLGYFLQDSFRRKWKWLLALILFMLTALNLFQTWQSSRGILDGARMTRALYKSVFLQTSFMTDDQKKLLLIDKYGASSETFNLSDTLNYESSVVQTLHFDQLSDHFPFSTLNIYHSPNRSIITNGSNPFAPAISNSYKDLTKKSFVWIKASAWVYSHHSLDSLDAALVVNMTHKDVSYKYREEPVAGHQFAKGSWNKVEKYFLTPDFMDKNDRIHVFFWNKSNHDIYVDDLKMEILEPKVDESVF